MKRRFSVVDRLLLPAIGAASATFMVSFVIFLLMAIVSGSDHQKDYFARTAGLYGFTGLATGAIGCALLKWQLKREVERELGMPRRFNSDEEFIEFMSKKYEVNTDGL